MARRCRASQAMRDATEGVLVPLVVVALVMTLGGVVVATLGHETKGRPLE